MSTQPDPTPTTGAGSEGLREAVEALARRWECRRFDPLPPALHRAACFSCSHADQLRALLAAHHAPEADDRAGERDQREPVPCPKCGEQCTFDGWDHVHANGVGIGSCPATSDASEVEHGCPRHPESSMTGDACPTCRAEEGASEGLSEAEREAWMPRWKRNLDAAARADAADADVWALADELCTTWHDNDGETDGGWLKERWACQDCYDTACTIVDTNWLAARVSAAATKARAEGAGDDGPCRGCGQSYPTWRAPNSLWNLVMGGPEATDDPGGMLCPNCFLRLADERAPVRGAWVVGTPTRPEDVVRAEGAAEAGDRADTAFLVGCRFGRESERERIARAIEAACVHFRRVTETDPEHPIARAYADAARIARSDAVSDTGGES